MTRFFDADPVFWMHNFLMRVLMSLYLVSCVVSVSDIGNVENVVIEGRPNRVTSRVVVPDDAVVMGRVPVRWSSVVNVPDDPDEDVVVCVGRSSGRALMYFMPSRRVVFVPSRRYALYYMLVGLAGIGNLEVPENIANKLERMVTLSIRRIVVDVAYSGRVEAVPPLCSEVDDHCFDWFGFSFGRLRDAVFRFDGHYWIWREGMLVPAKMVRPETVLKILTKGGASLRVKTRWRV